MPTFTVHDKNSAPDDAKPTLEQAKKQFWHHTQSLWGARRIATGPRGVPRYVRPIPAEFAVKAGTAGRAA